MKRIGVLGLFGLVTGLLVSILSPPKERLIWNRTGSAPKGLYWLSDEPFTHGSWVVVSASSDASQWAQARGYVGPGWPLLKQVSGMPGDEVCRAGREVSVNGALIGHALDVDARGRGMPVWTGCRRLQRDEIFLMNAHPASLDGRYFGVMAREDLEGVALRIDLF